MNRQQIIEKKVENFIKEQSMLKNGDSLVLGVSGGADSVCLFLLMLKWAKRENGRLYVVHINHGIREEAGQDAEYVKLLCEKNKVEFFLYEYDIPKMAGEWKASEEEAGRIARYKAFNEVAILKGADKIAVAHNKNDNSETVLFNLFRGSNLKGLTGITPGRDKIIRPLLVLTRNEIEEYLRENNIDYCTDRTNLGDDYSRNKIRHHILEYAEENLIQGSTENIADTAANLAEVEEYLALQTGEAMKECLDDRVILLDKFLNLHPVIQKRIIYDLIAEAAGCKVDIGRIHVNSVMNMLDKSGSVSLDLLKGVKAVKEYDRLYFSRGSEDSTCFEEKLIYPEENKELIVDLGEFGKAVIRVRDYNGESIPEVHYTKWLSYDKISKCISIRTRQAADELILSDGKGNLITKRVKDYMINEKIPASLRDKIPMVCSGNQVIWLIGYRISENFKVTSETKKILEIQIIRA